MKSAPGLIYREGVEAMSRTIESTTNMVVVRDKREIMRLI